MPDLRQLSAHQDHPVRGGQFVSVDHELAASTTSTFGRNSNRRGPVWMPVKHLAPRRLQHNTLSFGAGHRPGVPALVPDLNPVRYGILISATVRLSLRSPGPAAAGSPSGALPGAGSDDTSSLSSARICVALDGYRAVRLDLDPDRSCPGLRVFSDF
jgi:hypothetical protein